MPATARATRTRAVRARRNGLHELQCPECGGEVCVARDELVDGAEFECRHCGTQAELHEDFDTFARKKTWFLVDPRREADDAEERRK